MLRHWKSWKLSFVPFILIEIYLPEKENKKNKKNKKNDNLMMLKNT